MEGVECAYMNKSLLEQQMQTLLCKSGPYLSKFELR